MSDTMDDIRAAVATLGTDEPDASQPTAETPPAAEPTAQPTTEPPAVSGGRDESGRFAPKAPETPKDAPQEQQPAQANEAAQEPQQPAEAPQQPTRKPPQSWKPAVREKWAALPPEVQEEVARVDGETQKVLRESAQARRLADGFERTLQPYRAFIQGDPLQAVENVFRTLTQLQSAPPAHKAALVASIIKNYTVDVNALADALDGQPQSAQPSQAEYRDPRVDQLLTRLQHTEQQQAQRLAMTAQQELDSFSSTAEFLGDVQLTMADMMEVAARRGVALSLQDAYNAAVQVHPELTKVLEQRKAASAATAQQAATQRSRAAASSIRSEPAPGVTAKAGAGNTYDDVLSAAAMLSGR